MFMGIIYDFKVLLGKNCEYLQAGPWMLFLKKIQRQKILIIIHRCWPQDAEPVYGHRGPDAALLFV